MADINARAESTHRWAAIFNEFGQQTLGNVLYDAVQKLADPGDRVVIELSKTKNQYHALDITEHVDSLEADL